MFLTPDSTAISSDPVCRAVALPIELWPYAIGALESLTYYHNWEEFGDADRDELLQVFSGLLTSIQESCVVMAVGSIIPHTRANLPDNWLDCDGSVYLRTDYPDLFDALAAEFITDADHFQVPDLRVRFPIGAGLRDSVDLDPGDTGGEREHALSVSELPSHQHAITTEGVTAGFIGEIPSTVPIDNFPGQTGAAGGGAPHNNMPPYVALNYAIVARLATCPPAANGNGDAEYVSDWRALNGVTQIEEFEHGLGVYPSRVEVWWSDASDGSGTRWLVNVVGTNASGVNVARGFVIADDTKITTRTGNNTSSYAGVTNFGGLTGGYWQVRAWP